MTLLLKVLPDYGITTNWIEDPDDPDAYAVAITPRDQGGLHREPRQSVHQRHRSGGRGGGCS